MNVIARKEEVKILKTLLKSKKSEFLAIYGRRRVGKSFLINTFFEGQFAFKVTGMFNVNMSTQLANFNQALLYRHLKNESSPTPNSWLRAFHDLIKGLERLRSKRKIVFIDELPWFDSPRSGFISALEHFWNSWAAQRKDIILICCGSAASWMINKLINNKGGLHNRITQRIHLKPFDLKESIAFLKSKGAVYDAYQMAQFYMIMGGIPHYLNAIDTSQSLSQNIDKIFFSPHGILRDEYQNLYASLFKNHERHIAIVTALAKKAKGLSRTELARFAKQSNGGTFTNTLEELEHCGFIKRYYPFGKKLRDGLYQLIDPYTLFYHKFLKNSKSKSKGAWINRRNHSSWRSWSGYAFEYLCLSNVHLIKNCLGISGVYTETSAWRSQISDKGAQIDLIIDRDDRVINLCEIKFSENPFTISKAYADNLRNKVRAFQSETETRKTIFLTMICSFGLKENKHSQQLVQRSLTLLEMVRDG